MSDIDAIDFVKLDAQVASFQTEVHKLANDFKELLELANKSKGGFWMGMTIASMAGGVITFVAGKLLR